MQLISELVMFIGERFALGKCGGAPLLFAAIAVELVNKKSFN